MIQLFVGLIAEGTTDYLFLEPIIEKVLLDIAYDCRGQVDVDVKKIECDKGRGFTDYVLNAAQKGKENYISMFIVHTDADADSACHTYTHKINPAKTLLEQKEDSGYCKNLIALVPIQETESWMLADKNLFIKTIGTKKNENELNLNGHPETFNNPKERIENAIRIGRQNLPKKLRNSLKIIDLYSYLGQAMKIENLGTFKSYCDFNNNVRRELIKLNLLSENQ
ncbi:MULTISPECIES: DUF4276 family protein [Proteiniphilum]|jgi:hypothetical protein|uniref:DUF4276 family protein n=1 Tax=Proteiniphilum TaxID=294702 RepID=UPI00037B51F5|nr:MULTISPECIES: DUF4276 family protein [Proteiniphilum]